MTFFHHKDVVFSRFKARNTIVIFGIHCVRCLHHPSPWLAANLLRQSRKPFRICSRYVSSVPFYEPRFARPKVTRSESILKSARINLVVVECIVNLAVTAFMVSLTSIRGFSSLNYFVSPHIRAPLQESSTKPKSSVPTPTPRGMTTMMTFRAGPFVPSPSHPEPAFRPPTPLMRSVRRVLTGLVELVKESSERHERSLHAEPHASRYSRIFDELCSDDIEFGDLTSPFQDRKSYSAGQTFFSTGTNLKSGNPSSTRFEFGAIGQGGRIVSNFDLQ
jgi:hypothetical protein